MSYEKLEKLLDYIRENNSWEKCITKAYRSGKPLIKYIGIDIDSEDTDVYHIVLDNFSFQSEPNTNEKEFEDAIYSYLNDCTFRCKFMKEIEIEI